MYTNSFESTKGQCMREKHLSPSVNALLFREEMPLHDTARLMNFQPHDVHEKERHLDSLVSAQTPSLLGGSVKSLVLKDKLHRNGVG